MPEKKIDFKKEYREYYKPSGSPQVVNVPEMQFLMIDGQGSPGESKEFQQAVEALFAVSYKAKFMLKNNAGFDYTVMPLEGLWWADDMADFVEENRDKWKWTLMIMQPSQVTKQLIAQSIDIAKSKKELPSANKLRLEHYTEGASVQIMHIEPFSEEHANIMKIHAVIEELGGKLNGHTHKHHEIYLSDFRKVAPEKMRTVLRQPYIK